MSGEPLLSVTELAKRLNVPVQTVYLWNSAGKGPRRVRIGKHVRYRPEDVDAWLADQVVGQDA